MKSIREKRNVERILYILLCVLMIDCCIFGAGRVFMAGGISFRMLLLAILCVLALPLCLKKIKSILGSKYFWLLTAFGIWTVVALVRGILAENRQILILSDVKGFLYFVTFPIMLVVLKKKEQFRKLMKCAMYATTVLSIYSIGMIALYNLLPEMFNVMYRYGLERNFSGFSAVSATLVRLFFNSSMYAVCGCAFAVYFQVVEEKGLRFSYVIITAINLVALLLTYTRSIYLGTGVAAGVLACALLLWGSAQKKALLLKHLGGAVGGFVALMLLINLCTQTGYFQYAFERTLGTFSEAEQEHQKIPDITVGNTTAYYQELTVISDELRENTLTELAEKIKEAPIWGNGLGTELDCRPKGYNEYFFLDLWAKSGVIGVFLYLSPIVCMFWDLWKNHKKKREELPFLISWLAVLLGFCVFSFFNPYMNASLGITFYGFCMALFSNQKEEQFTYEYHLEKH